MLIDQSTFSGRTVHEHMYRSSYGFDGIPASRIGPALRTLRMDESGVGHSIIGWHPVHFYTQFS
jgi:hypothetical protein